MTEEGARAAHAGHGKDAARKLKEAELATLLLGHPGLALTHGELAPGRYARISVLDEGRGMDDATIERIFEPLGMSESGYDSTRPLIEKRAAGYDATLDGYVNTAYLDMGEPYAAGSLYSSVDDLLKWDQSLYGEKILISNVTV